VQAEDLAENIKRGVLGAIGRLALMPECYAAPLDNGEPIIIERATRTQAWTAGAIWALENNWDGQVDIDAIHPRRY
jgi:hypothetical protein